MIKSVLAAVAIAALATGPALAQSPELIQALRGACKNDAERLCGNPDALEVASCLQEHDDELSDGCKDIIHDEQMNELYGQD